MSRIQNGKNRNPEKPIPGCLGRMVNLFDSNTVVGGNRLLTDKPYDGSSFSRRHSDVSKTSLVDDQMDDKVMVSELRKAPSSNRKLNGTPIKMLIAQEMSKEDDCKQSPSNLVARLMGLDALPDHTRESRSQSGSSELFQQDHGLMNKQSKHVITKYPKPEEYKDVFEICQQDREPDKMDLVREKFMEAKRLSTDEKLRQSKQFQDALEVLSSNKDLFLEFLQEPNSLFSRNLYGLQSVPPPPDSRRITVLKPSKSVDNHKIKIIDSGKKNEKTADFLFSPECRKTDDNPTQPTRIVVLKPSSVRPRNIEVVDREDSAVLESREVTESGLIRRDETVHSSVFSNGYIGDDSSFGKSEIDYTAGNLSDSEAVSPISRHSWDYINRLNSPYSTSSSRVSYSPESSVCREAKKRLSERWAMMASNKNVLEQRQIQRSSSTLGDMLALSDFKKSVNSEEICKSKKDSDNGPTNLPRSRSVPASSSGLGVEVSGFSNSKRDGTEDLVTEKVVKSLSFKGRVSSLFFSKNKKSSKEKFLEVKDVTQSARFPVHSRRDGGNEGSECINGTNVEEESCGQGSTDMGVKHGIILPEVGFSFTKTEIRGNHGENQDQPSPISVLEPQFEEDDRSTNCHRDLKANAHGIEPMRYNLIDKSPPIGSIARTLSWDDSTLGSSTPYTGRPAPAPLNPEEEERECLFYVQSLLSVAGLNGKVRSNSFLARWHSPESPLDPSLRDKYMNLISEKDPIQIQTKHRRHHTGISKLVFDSVNESLRNIAGRGPCSGAHSSLEDMVCVKDRVWAQMKEWLSVVDERWDWEEGGGGGGGGSVAVEEVVRKEVVGRGWVEGVRVESEDTRKEIERKLLEMLVEECVLELTGRV